MKISKEKPAHKPAIPQYINQARIEACRPHEENIKDFFKILCTELPNLDEATYSSSDKNHLPRAISKALRALLAPDVNISKKESEIGFFKLLSELPTEASFLNKKRPDYIIENKERKKVVILELKTNITVNDFSAAVVQAALIKNNLIKDGGYKYYMASIHMSRWLEKLDKYKWINSQFNCPLDDIWTFSSKETKSSDLAFDVGEIRRFRSKIIDFLNGPER